MIQAFLFDIRRSRHKCTRPLIIDIRTLALFYRQARNSRPGVVWNCSVVYDSLAHPNTARHRTWKRKKFFVYRNATREIS